VENMGSRLLVILSLYNLTRHCQEQIQKSDTENSIHETLLLQIKPKEVVLEKGNVSNALLKKLDG
jgi:hypothetical protein